MNGTVSYAEEVTLVSIMALICGPSTGTAFGAQPVAIRTVASRMLMNVAIIEQCRDVIAFMPCPSNRCLQQVW
jgi:hypothetical protein